MSQPGDDAQRDLEQRALRNVRGLLDKIEKEERIDRKRTVRIALACGAVVLAFLVVLVGFLGRRAEPPAAAIVIPAPAKNTK